MSVCRGCSESSRRSSLHPMNEHTVPSDVGGYLFEFRRTRPLRETARWVTGLGLVLAGAAISVIGNASSSYMSLPLGIAIAVLGILLLTTYAYDRNKANRTSPAEAGKHRTRSVRKANSKESLASQLALVADLYSQGALTRREFEAAKRRLLDN